MKRRLKILFLCLLCCLPLRGRDRDRQADLREEIAFLCDSLQAGRGIGTVGAHRTTFYLLGQLRNAGLNAFVQSFRQDGCIGRNIIAITPGFYAQYIVVSAYFDGLGILDGTFYPGADANASGVAALLALARELTPVCTGLTGLIFVAFDGHNTGLSGSRAFLERYRGSYPIRQLVNLDILGSTLAPVVKTSPEHLIVLGGSGERFSLDSANRDTRLHLTYDYYGSDSFTELFYRRISDQSWFLQAGIPAVMFTSGITLNTNKQTDTPDTIDYPVLDKRIQVIFNWLRRRL